MKANFMETQIKIRKKLRLKHYALFSKGKIEHKKIKYDLKGVVVNRC